MMGGAKKRVPKRRFKEFLNAGEWKERKLSELATMNARIGWQNLRTSEFLDSGDYLLITGTDFDNGRVKYSTCHYVEKKRFDQDTKIQLSTGSILITKDGTLGKVALVEELPKPATLNAGVFNVRVKDDTVLSYKYLYHYLKAPFLMKYVTANATGGTIKHLNQSILVDFPIPITEKPEQDRITKLLDSLESSITLHQRKLDKLQATKKALLQEMFPEEGQNKPKRRFKGFTDAWEQRKLGDFYTFKNGLNKEKVYFGYGDSIVNFTDVFHNRQIYSSTLKGKVCVNKKELENYKVKEGDLFFTRTSETIDEIGFPAVVMEPMERVVFSGFVLRGRAEKNDPLVNIFKSYIFFTDNFRSEMKKKSSMTTRALTSGTALKEMYFSYPKDLEEQTKIGEILLRLDNIITLHQRKLDKLKNLKQAYLNEMFV